MGRRREDAEEEEAEEEEEQEEDEEEEDEGDDEEVNEDKEQDRDLDGGGNWDTDEDEAAEDEVDEPAYISRWRTCRCSCKCSIFLLDFHGYIAAPSPSALFEPTDHTASDSDKRCCLGFAEDPRKDSEPRPRTGSPFTTVQ